MFLIFHTYTHAVVSGLRETDSSRTAGKLPAVEGIPGAPELLWTLSGKPVRRTAPPTQTVAKESQADQGSRATALF